MYDLPVSIWYAAILAWRGLNAFLLIVHVHVGRRIAQACLQHHLLRQSHLLFSGDLVGIELVEVLAVEVARHLRAWDRRHLILGALHLAPHRHPSFRHWSASDREVPVLKVIVVELLLKSSFHQSDNLLGLLANSFIGSN